MCRTNCLAIVIKSLSPLCKNLIPPKAHFITSEESEVMQLMAVDNNSYQDDTISDLSSNILEHIGQI